MMLAAIPPPPGQQIDIGPLSIHYYGILIGIGVLLAIALGRRRYAALGGDPDMVDRVGFVAVLAGLLGGRFGYVLTNVSSFSDRPWAVLFVWEGGLAIFGGLTVGFLVGIWYANRIGMSVTRALDAMVPGIPLAQAIGRWGNYFNQELYGTPTDLPWALEVEPARRVAPYTEFSTFHPTFLYESLLNLVLVGVLLWFDRRGRLRQGSLVFIYLAGYGFIRFWVELIRTDTTFRILGLSRNNWIALFVFIGALIALRWWQTRGPDRPIGTPIEPEHAASEQATPNGAASGGATSDGTASGRATSDDAASEHVTSADSDGAERSEPADAPTDPTAPRR
jgi:prolipoprotein diacylglyceryl transferase